MLDLLIMDYAAHIATGASGGAPPPSYTDPGNFPTDQSGVTGAPPDYTDPDNFPSGGLDDILENPTQSPPDYDPMDYSATGPSYGDYHDFPSYVC